ncbi:MAG TPA: HD-GYP domain-containing protein [Solirubrobacteraceae bacterium]|jgi:hypothetical protein|nr:HD-GYP domain-containing protein [Solirubrobacteraceae bacterium]
MSIAARSDPGTLAQPAAEPDERRAPPPEAWTAPSMWRYLPLALATTSLVVLAPALIAIAIVPRDGTLSTIGSAALAMIASLALASGGAALWRRQTRSRDVVFAELLLWGWIRRWWTERRLSQARELVETVRLATAEVDIELLGKLSRLIEARDSYLHGHSRRVARHAVRIARTMGLAPDEITKIRTAAEVHDVGKLYTPRAILNNPGRLTDAELAIVELHANDGARIVAGVGDTEITAMVRHHHERIDGGGYPDGLAGSAIPLGARLIAVADTFDAITSARAYRAAGSQKRAFDVLAAEAGAQLDADAVAAFARGCAARRSVAWTALAAAALQRATSTLVSAPSNLGAGAASLGSLAPALGAAGVLALSPGLFRDSRAPAPKRGLATALAASLPAHATPTPASGQAPSVPSPPGSPVGRRPTRSLRPVDGRGVTPAFQAPRSTSTPTPTAAAGASPAAQTGTSSVAPASGGGGSSSSPSSLRQPGPSGPTRSIPTVTPPSVSSPSVSAPTVTAPVVSAPSVSTPSITTPSITVGGANRGSVTVPGVTVPSVTVPSVTVPSATIPKIELPNTLGR